MNRRKRNTRGVTLAELCIVMAVIAIVSTMVVSFTVLMQARTRVIAADRDTVSDLGTVESALDRFIRTYDSDEYAIVQSDLISTADWEHLASSTTLDKYTSIAVLKDGVLIAKLKLSTDPETEKVNAIVITDGGGKAEITYLLNSVTKMTFELEGGNSSGSATALVICTVEYTSTHGTEQVTKKATICHAVRAMKFVAASPDLETVKLAVSEFLKNYGTEEFHLGVSKKSADSPEADPYVIISAEAQNENLPSYGNVYQLLPKDSDDGKIVALVILASIKSDGKEPQIIVRRPLYNVTKIEYTPKYVNVEGTEQLSYISCKVTYATGEVKTEIVWNPHTNTVTVVPAEGGIEP